MKLQKITFCLWLLLVTGGIVTYFIFPEKLSLSFMKENAKNHLFATLIIYYLILSFRGLTLIPSSPLLLAGLLVFDPLNLFIVNMAGIMTSSTIVYFFSKYLGFDIYFETKYSKYTQKIRAKLLDKELPIIVGWSFFPLAPTDLIVYVGSTLRISVFRCLLGVFIGESLINAFYIITATTLLKGILL
jgi:uncharacterized membrane protein YdjX (TVP38/TMEM64 family)